MPDPADPVEVALDPPRTRTRWRVTLPRDRQWTESLLRKGGSLIFVLENTLPGALNTIGVAVAVSCYPNAIGNLVAAGKAVVAGFPLSTDAAGADAEGALGRLKVSGALALVPATAKDQGLCRSCGKLKGNSSDQDSKEWFHHGSLKGITRKYRNRVGESIINRDSKAISCAPGSARLRK